MGEGGWKWRPCFLSASRGSASRSLGFQTPAPAADVAPGPGGGGGEGLSGETHRGVLKPARPDGRWPQVDRDTPRGGKGDRDGEACTKSWDRYRLLCVWLHLLDGLFILLTLICNWVDQQLFFLEGVIRIINKAKWKAWMTYSCVFCAVMSPGGPQASSPENAFSNNTYVASWAPVES